MSKHQALQAYITVCYFVRKGYMPWTLHTTLTHKQTSAKSRNKCYTGIITNLARFTHWLGTLRNIPLSPKGNRKKQQEMLCLHDHILCTELESSLIPWKGFFNTSWYVFFWCCKQCERMMDAATDLSNSLSSFRLPIFSLFIPFFHLSTSVMTERRDLAVISQFRIPTANRLP